MSMAARSLPISGPDSPALQAHPSAAQAAEGFARENAAGISVDAPTRNYRDPSHKPELICALTEFHALVGFREIPGTLALLHALDVAELAPHVALLADQPRSQQQIVITLRRKTPAQRRLGHVTDVIGAVDAALGAAIADSRRASGGRGASPRSSRWRSCWPGRCPSRHPDRVVPHPRTVSGSLHRDGARTRRREPSRRPGAAAVTRGPRLTTRGRPSR
jgi:hypothetical protein